jgi:predicted amidohydrolase
MKEKLNISLLQMIVEIGKVDSNLAKIESLVSKSITPASKEFPHIICLPELSTTGFDLINYKKLAERIPGGKTTRFLQQIAKKHAVYLITSIIEEFNGSYFNCALIINSSGELMTKYRKIHLFPLKPMEEAEFFKSGDYFGVTNKQTTVKVGGMKIGVLICFDIRYPELSRRLALEGVNLLIYVAEFPRPRDDVWSVLLQARAMENQIFVVGVNSIGGTNEASFFGKSMVIDPFGNIILEGNDQEQLLFATIDPNLLSEANSFIPTLELRRPSQY